MRRGGRNTINLLKYRNVVGGWGMFRSSRNVNVGFRRGGRGLEDAGVGAKGSTCWVSVIREEETTGMENFVEVVWVDLLAVAAKGEILGLWDEMARGMTAKINARDYVSPSGGILRNYRLNT